MTITRATVFAIGLLAHAACGGSSRRTTPRPAADAVPTGADCARLASHLEELLRAEEGRRPDGAELDPSVLAAGTAEVCVDRATRAEYACAMAGTSSDAIAGCMQPASERTVSDRLSDAECTQLVSRLLAQPGAAGSDQPDSAGLHAECMVRASRNRYACIMAANDPTALGQCMPEGTWKSR